MHDRMKLKLMKLFTNNLCLIFTRFSLYVREIKTNTVVQLILYYTIII